MRKHEKISNVLSLPYYSCKCNLQADSPSGRQMTALGKYILMSLFFVVVGMAEFAILLFLLRRTENSAHRRRFRPNLSKQLNHPSEHECNEDRRNVSINSNSASATHGNKGLHFNSISTRIDLIATITFPLAYVLFNIFYWTTYLH